jgi:hypothetical protein
MLDSQCAGRGGGRDREQKQRPGHVRPDHQRTMRQPVNPDAGQQAEQQRWGELCRPQGSHLRGPGLERECSGKWERE